MEDKDYTITEGYELPSRGKIYKQPVNPHIELRSMTARDEMKRLAPSTRPFKVLSDIIENCIVGEKPAIHVYDMCLGDYEFLLQRLRVVTYGEKYKMSVVCPNCGEQTTVTVDLDKNEMKEFSREKFMEYSSFDLPKSGKHVELNFATPRMLDDINLRKKELSNKFTEADIDMETFVKMLKYINTYDGRSLTEEQLNILTNSMPAADQRKILNNIDKLNFCIGMENIFYVTCTKCGENIPTFFRFGSEFFGPTDL